MSIIVALKFNHIGLQVIFSHYGYLRHVQGATIQSPGGAARVRSSCQSQIIYFKPAQRRAEHFKFYYMFIYEDSSRCKLFTSFGVRRIFFISKILLPPPPHGD